MPSSAANSPLRILPHSNTCPYVVRTLAQAETALDKDRRSLLLVTAGCDAMRRAGEALAALFGDRVRVCVVPRTSDPGSIAAMARELDAVGSWLTKAATSEAAETTTDAAAPATASLGAEIPPATGARPADESDAASPATAPTARVSGFDAAPASEGNCGTFAYPGSPRPGGAYVVGGPHSDGALLSFLERTGSAVSGVDSCRGPECGALLRDLGRSGLGTTEIAAALLGTPSCPRSQAGERLDYLGRRLTETGATAVLYTRLPFCDPGAYDAVAVRALADERGLPFLEVEVDYPLEIAGPVRVRIEAFLETLTLDDSLLQDDDDPLFDVDDDSPSDRDPLFDDDGPFAGDDDSQVDARPPATGATRSGGSTPDQRPTPAGPLASAFTRRALTAASIVATYQSGTARRYLESHALRASLDLYKPGAFVPWVSYLFPPEIAASYGLTPLIPEVAAATLTGTDFRPEVEAAMNRLPLSRDTCSYHRAAKAALGAGLLPPPSVCLGTTPLCLGKECLLDAAALQHGVPYDAVRVPLPPDEGPASAEAVADVADQLREVHARLGELTGRRAALGRAVALSNRASAAWSEVCARRLDGRLLLNGRQTFSFTFLGQVLWGTEAGAKGFEKLLTRRGMRDILLAERADGGTSDRGDGGGRGRDSSRPRRDDASPRPRLLWLHTMPHHDRTLFDLIAERGGAVVFEEMARVHLEPLDPADPFPGMARRLIEHPLWGSASRRARLVLDLVHSGDIDGVVHFNHWGCRHGLGTLPVLRDSLAAAGVPFVALDGDALDQPSRSPNGATTQLEAFLEML